MLFILFLALIPLLLISYLFTYPRYTEEDELVMLKKYESIRKDLLSVMTFNIRFDGPEQDSNNHFNKRIFRLTETIEKWQPNILCLQEPFTDQLQRLHSHLPKYYQYIGYNQPVVDTVQNRDEFLSRMDFEVAILYDTQILTLLEQDYIWLSNKDWGKSHRPRALNIGRFKLNNNNNTENSTNILVFNTHLDVRSERARQEEAKVIRSTIKQWQDKYPQDLVFLCGDFNTIPQQTTYNILTSRQFLYDTWTSADISNSFASTFHGWWGSIVNTYGFQLVQMILFTFRGLSIDLTYEISIRIPVIINIIKQIWNIRRMISLSELISLWTSHRIHVDWILYQHSMNEGSYRLQPRFISIVDIRSTNYSSDHFPVVALFEIKNDS